LSDLGNFLHSGLARLCLMFYNSAGAAGNPKQKVVQTECKSNYCDPPNYCANSLKIEYFLFVTVVTGHICSQAWVAKIAMA